MINTKSESLKGRKIYFQYLSFYEQLKIHALTVKLSMKKVLKPWGKSSGFVISLLGY